MTLDDLVAEGEALARLCYLLTIRPTSDRRAGFWGGERADQPHSIPPEATAVTSRRHIVTIDGALLTALGLPSAASLGVIETKRRHGGQYYSVIANPQFAEIRCTGEPLYAAPHTSFPPFEAVCLYGSAKVERWLSDRSIARHEYGALDEDPLVRQYRDVFTRRAPFYTSQADVVVGGWHMIWPADDFFMPLEMRLVLTTLRDAEPWYEVWVTSSGVHNYSVKARSTQYFVR